MPPITTASNAKISEFVPWNGFEGADGADEDPGQRGGGHRDARHPGEDRPDPDADQPGGVEVVGGGPDLAAPGGQGQQQLQAGQDRAGGQEGRQEQPGHGDLAADAEAGQTQRAGRQAAGIGGGLDQQQVLDHDRQAERDQHRGQLAVPQRPPNSSTWSTTPGRERGGQHQRQRDPDRDAERGGQHQAR